MLKLPSTGGLPVSSTRSIQYLKDEAKAVVPASVK
jgi:hypothetical protein